MARGARDNQLQLAELQNLPQEQLVETCTRLASRYEMMEVLLRELHSEQSKLQRQQGMLNDHIRRAEGSISDTGVGTTWLQQFENAMQACDLHAVASGISDAPSSAGPAAAAAAAALHGGVHQQPQQQQQQQQQQLQQQQQHQAAPWPAAEKKGERMPLSSEMDTTHSTTAGTSEGAASSSAAGAGGVIAAALRDRLACQISPPEELLLRQGPSGSVRLTWFYNEQLLEQLINPNHPLRSLSFEVRQQSEGANGRLRLRTHACECRTIYDGDEVAEQSFEIESCVPGRAYAFSVRAVASYDGMASPLYSPYSDMITMGEFPAMPDLTVSQGQSTSASTPRALSLVGAELQAVLRRSPAGKREEEHQAGRDEQHQELLGESARQSAAQEARRRAEEEEEAAAAATASVAAVAAAAHAEENRKRTEEAQQRLAETRRRLAEEAAAQRKTSAEAPGAAPKRDGVKVRTQSDLDASQPSTSRREAVEEQSDGVDPEVLRQKVEDEVRRRVENERKLMMEQEAEATSRRQQREAERLRIEQQQQQQQQHQQQHQLRMEEARQRAQYGLQRHGEAKPMQVCAAEDKRKQMQDDWACAIAEAEELAKCADDGGGSSAAAAAAAEEAARRRSRPSMIQAQTSLQGARQHQQQAPQQQQQYQQQQQQQQVSTAAAPAGLAKPGFAFAQGFAQYCNNKAAENLDGSRRTTAASSSRKTSPAPAPAPAQDVAKASSSLLQMSSAPTTSSCGNSRTTSPRLAEATAAEPQTAAGPPTGGSSSVAADDADPMSKWMTKILAEKGGAPLMASASAPLDLPASSQPTTLGAVAGARQDPLGKSQGHHSTERQGPVEETLQQIPGRAPAAAASAAAAAAAAAATAVSGSSLQRDTVSPPPPEGRRLYPQPSSHTAAQPVGACVGVRGAASAASSMTHASSAAAADGLGPTVMRLPKRSVPAPILRSSHPTNQQATTYRAVSETAERVGQRIPEVTRAVNARNGRSPTRPNDAAGLAALNNSMHNMSNLSVSSAPRGGPVAHPKASQQTWQAPTPEQLKHRAAPAMPQGLGPAAGPPRSGSFGVVPQYPTVQQATHQRGRSSAAMPSSAPPTSLAPPAVPQLVPHRTQAMGAPYGAPVSSHPPARPGGPLEMSQRMARANELQQRLNASSGQLRQQQVPPVLGHQQPPPSLPQQPPAAAPPTSFPFTVPSLLNWAQDASQHVPPSWSTMHDGLDQSTFNLGDLGDPTGDPFGLGLNTLHNLPPPPRSAPAVEAVPGLGHTMRGGADKSMAGAQFMLTVLTSDNRWETLIFFSGDDLGQVGARFLQEKGLKAAFQPGLVNKMRSMMAAGQTNSRVDIVDLI